MYCGYQCLHDLSGKRRVHGRHGTLIKKAGILFAWIIFLNYRNGFHKLNCMAAQTLLSTVSHFMPLRLLTGARCLLFSSIPRRKEVSLLSPMTVLHFSMVRHYYLHTPYPCLGRMFNPNHIYQAWCLVFSIMNPLTGTTGAYLDKLACWNPIAYSFFSAYPNYIDDRLANGKFL